MKRLELKSNDKFSVRALVAMLFEAPMPSRTFSYRQAAEIVGLLKKLKDAPEDATYVILENSEYAMIKKTVEEFQFAFMTAPLFEILETVMKAEDFALKEVG